MVTRILAHLPTTDQRYYQNARRLMRLSQPNAVTRLAAAMAARVEAVDSHPQPAKGLEAEVGSHRQPACVDSPGLIRLRPDRVRTDQEPVVFSFCFLLFEVDRRVLLPRQTEDAPEGSRVVSYFLSCSIDYVGLPVSVGRTPISATHRIIHHSNRRCPEYSRDWERDLVAET
jgi:hypothetical protein